ncbi:hypothetical protein [Paenibacillus mendelii]|uniref:Uncharacterized protein n=1 Tax=Paenibacillus mendelii TaxID=206163 RepID=A0ABV6J4M2_9BACL|nr:hypothetical protein [Paenibacillus mendelii]
MSCFKSSKQTYRQVLQPLCLPINNLCINESDEGEVSAQGQYVSGNPVFFSIKLPACFRLDEVDFKFIRERIEGVSAYTDAARDFLTSSWNPIPKRKARHR